MRLPHLVSAAISMLGLPVIAWCVPFTQTNLSSDIPGLAANTDPSMKNPWGISFSGTSPIWVSDQGTGLSTLYDGNGVKQTRTLGGGDGSGGRKRSCGKRRAFAPPLALDGIHVRTPDNSFIWNGRRAVSASAQALFSTRRCRGCAPHLPGDYRGSTALDVSAMTSSKD